MSSSLRECAVIGACTSVRSGLMRWPRRRFSLERRVWEPEPDEADAARRPVAQRPEIEVFDGAVFAARQKHMGVVALARNPLDGVLVVVQHLYLLRRQVAYADLQ